MNAMNISADDIWLVQQSWEKVLPISQTAGEIFYDRLTEINPEFNLLISTDHVEQVKSFMEMLDIIIHKLDDPYSILPVYHSKDYDKIGYGVLETADYDTTYNAFEWTLKHGLGDDFTDEVKMAWHKVFRFMHDLLNAHPAAVH